MPPSPVLGEGGGVFSLFFSYLFTNSNPVRYTDGVAVKHYALKDYILESFSGRPVVCKILFFDFSARRAS